MWSAFYLRPADPKIPHASIKNPKRSHDEEEFT